MKSVSEYSQEHIELIAKVCHETNKAYCDSIGDHTQKHWWFAPEWQKKSAVSGVVFHLSNPDAGDSASHDNWMKDKAADGWVYGKVKDETLKTHHCMVPFDQLPVDQQKKDKLFRAIVHALA